MYDFKNKRVLVAGGTGLIGTPLVEMLLEKGALVSVVSLDNPSRAHPDVEFSRLDLTDFTNCMRSCCRMEYVFNLLCVKGSPTTVKARPAHLLVPQLLFNTNLMESARRNGAEGFLFTSSIGIYDTAQVFREDSVWDTPLPQNDRFPACAKRAGELQAEAYRIEYGWNSISIVRPANTYGPFDDFESDAAMVVPSFIRKVVSRIHPLCVRGDGSEVRDFVYARDVARGMILVAEQGVTDPVNLGSGVGVSIRELLDIVCQEAGEKPSIEWDPRQYGGDRIRVMDVTRASALGFRPEISLRKGISDTIKWYRDHKLGSA